MLPQGPYEPQKYEKEMLDSWLENKYYKPEYDPETEKVLTTDEMKNKIKDKIKKEGVNIAWALICPPPNAYARPHIGNISGYAYQDAMARYQRMLGKKVLVLPGKDHAGLEGEGVFVRDVLEKQGRNKFDMTREDFYKEVWDFFQKNMDIALKDERDIGLSADFDRDTFTLDPDIVETVLDTFVEMYNAGMIYKGVRIVNWDPKARTAVADNQVEYKESQTPFYYFKYGFAEAEPEAIKLKNDYQNKEIEWKFERNITKDGKSELPFAYGHLITTPNLSEGGVGEIEIIGIGYPKDTKSDSMLKGKVVGIQMRLDKKFRLVVTSSSAQPTPPASPYQGSLSVGAAAPLIRGVAEINKIFLFEIKHYAGAHIILFDEYPDDKFYNNGFVLGTVRLETKFGDTAIAVNPKDDRYKDFVGKKIKVRTLLGDNEINIVDDYLVDPEFGTGAVKVTPAHSAVDWEIAQRHPEQCLPPKQVIGYDLKLNHLTGKYEGLSIKQARPVIAEDMKKEGMLIYVDETYQNRIQIAERTKAPIEPLLSSQWYLKYDGIKEAAMQMVINAKRNRVGVDVETRLIASIPDIPNAPSDIINNPDMAVQIHPENMEQKFEHWMQNLRDWAISRSLWWGYRMPVWYAGKIEERIDETGQVREYIKLGTGDWISLEYSNPNHIKIQKTSPGEGWIQDDNVLDTWFSSGQWVYATLTKWGLMETFFPTNVLVSAHDILENWDSRMMMFTYFKHHNIPFHDLFLTGLVLGTDGQKMSKSKGNIIDMDMVRNDYGTDSVRMAYFYQNSAGSSYVVSPDKLKNFKQFNNKIWNAAKFVLMNTTTNSSQFVVGSLQLDLSKQIIEHITKLKEKITKNMDNLEFGYATESLYQEFWHTFCDLQIEQSKKYLYPEKNKDTGEIISEPKAEEKIEIQQVLLFTLKEYLKMLHPFIPFITDKIWQATPKESGDFKSLMYTRW